MTTQLQRSRVAQARTVAAADEETRFVESPPPRPPGGRRGGAGETGARPNHARVAVTLLGATCCEDDVIGDAVVPPEHLAALDVGARVVLSGVTGYAVGWNRAFAGVPAAQVVTVASD